ncbi:MAG TPA: YbaK/EbsC family protein [bacterium]|nr:YbaK/EbsC family protein [bacterium]
MTAGLTGGGQSAPERVRTALAARGLTVEIVEFSESTRTAEEAARAVGVTVGQIVKSLVFVADGRPVLVLTSGGNRVDLKKVARLAGASRVEKATAEMTRAATGFSIGGVPPVGHPTTLPVLVDEMLLRYAVVYASAGTPHAVFAIAPRDLERVTGGMVADVVEPARA